MKNNKILIITAFVVIFLLGILLGFNLKSNQSTQINQKPPDLKPSSGSCQYNGKNYQTGERFKAKDGCNSCTCNNGNVACTLMGC